MTPTIEVEPDEDGYHAIVITADGEYVLYVTDSYLTRQDAEHAARGWINHYHRWPVPA